MSRGIWRPFVYTHIFGDKADVQKQEGGKGEMPFNLFLYATEIQSLDPHLESEEPRVDHLTRIVLFCKVQFFIYCQKKEQEDNVQNAETNRK